MYEIFILGDTLIFNVVEFWSGSNPIAMKDGFYMVYLPNGKTVKMDASTTQMEGLAKINAQYNPTRWAAK